MKRILQKTTAILILSSFMTGFLPVYSADEKKQDLSYTENRTVDAGTFNAYRYKMTKEFFVLRNTWDVNYSMSIDSLSRLQTISKESFNYLPDSLTNDNYLSKLYSSLEKAKKEPKNQAYYTDVISKLEDYLDKVSIKTLKGSTEATPKEGNAPMNVTFRASVTDPEGTIIPKYNYTWWMDVGGKRKILGTGVSLNYNFTEEGKYSVFVDVVSNHKNKKGFTDVLPFRGKTDITVKEKVASLILKVNSENLANTDSVKFTPDDAKYGLIFDATSSTPTGGAKFTKTSWDFGNGKTKTYSGEPKVERVIYSKEGDYTVTLKLTTNLGNSVTKEFSLAVHDPVATIIANPEEGFLGDKFTFSAKTGGKNEDNLTYSWEIVDIAKDKVIFSKQTKLFTYNFPDKGNYNVKLKTSGASSNDYDVDTKIIHINSRAPVASFKSSIPKQNNPNTVLLNASDSYDLDFTDSGKLEFSWIIDGDRVELDNPNSNGSVGYYTFDSIGEHSVTLEVIDPDNIKGVKDDKVNIASVLSVDFSALPIAVKLGEDISFKANSPEARIYEWDFGDTKKEGGIKSSIKHVYEQAGIYTVSLKVRDGSDNTNTVNGIVYVGNGSKPVAILEPKLPNAQSPALLKNACEGKDAYLANRATPIEFDASKSINIDGQNSDLTYSLKVSDGKYLTTSSSSYKFDELGCFPIKLTVTSNKNNSTDTKNIWVKVENQAPTLTGLVATAAKTDTDPVVIDVQAVGAKDEDGVITSYLWYYYTDTDTEPQDFRSTTTPNTKFVLPKITGNYYFVVVLIDDNEKRIASNELGRTSSITLTGDNANVPIVELTTPDNSVYLEDEVVFNANVKNILGKNIAKESRYYWDFDGDGFYDTETSTPTISYKYTKSGEYFAKVKVKYKGFSNTRIISVAVANRVIADFDYISIGNKFIFINKSTGSFSNVSWDLGDGTKITGKNTVTHEYKDGKSSHDVKLLVSETGGVAKSTTKIATKNMKNMILAKKDGLIIFTNPSFSKDDKITLEKQAENIYVYALVNDESIVKFGVDLDTETDSDLNGSKQDDKDITNSSLDVFPVKLDTKNANQKIKIFSINSDGVVIDSKILTIDKAYLKDKDTIDMEKIVFSKVTDAEKEKIDYLKILVADLPAELKTPSMEYLKRLQEEWGDNTEKTKILLEFERFLDSTKLANKAELIDTLESLLVEEQTDKSEKNIAFNALRNLVPKKIECTFDTKQFKTCKEEIISKLEAIKVSSDLDISKKLSKEVLDVIAATTLMTTDEKLDFKAILGNLVYGETTNIPKEEVQQVATTDDGGIISSILSIIKVILYIVIGLILLLSLFAFGYFIYYKTTNKNPEIDFKTFVKNKISNKKPSVNNAPVDLDILSDISEKEETNDILGTIEEVKQENIVETKTQSEIKASDSSIPDWLKGASLSVSDDSFKLETETKEEKQEETKQEEIKQEEKGFSETPDFSFQENKEENKEEIKEETPISDIVSEKQDKIPDWLKDSFSTEETSPVPETNTISEDISNPVEENEKAFIKETPTKQDKIPDWLKDSFSTEETSPVPETNTISEDISNPEIVEEQEQIIANDFNFLEEEKQEEVGTSEIEAPIKQEDFMINDLFLDENIVNKTTTEANLEELVLEETKAKPKAKAKAKAETKTKKTIEKKDDEAKKDELWDDGMEIPDWLKSDDEK